MASKLPGWSFLLAGIAMIGFSQFIEKKTANSADPANLVVFFWIGVGFIVFGAYREFIPRLRKRTKTVPTPVGPPPVKAEPPHNQRHPAMPHVHGTQPHATHQHVTPAQHPSHPHQPASKPCPHCRQTIPYENRFCAHCGFRFY